MMPNLPSDGGYDFARVSYGEDDARVRVERARGARRNLASLLVDKYGGLVVVEADEGLAQVVAEEFAELCAALGLESPPESDVPPGICHRKGRGNELSLTGAGPRGMGKASLSRVRGFCSRRCEQMVNLKRIEGVT